MVKEVIDYIPELQKKYPEFSQSELKEIIDYGLKVYGFANKYKADVTLFKRDDDPIVIHTGDLGYDTFKHYLRWVTKYRMKERVIWRLLGNEWDGYYYIGLNDEQHKEMLRQKGKKKVFKKVYLTRILKELYHNKLVTHIWKVPYPIKNGFKFYTDKLTSYEAEYIGKNQYGKYHQCFLGRNNFGQSSTVDEGNSTD